MMPRDWLHWFVAGVFVAALFAAGYLAGYKAGHDSGTEYGIMQERKWSKVRLE